MVPDERNGPDKRECHRSKNPVGEFSPVHFLDSMEIGPDKFPSAEDINLHRPDRADIVETKREI